MGVAVDGAPAGELDETAGDVYVATNGYAGFNHAKAPAFDVVDVFDPKEEPVKGQEPGKVVGELRGVCPAKGPVCNPAEQAAHPFSEVSASGEEALVKSVAVSAANGDVLVTVAHLPESGSRTGVVDVFAPVAKEAGKNRFLFAISEANGVPLGA